MTAHTSVLSVSESMAMLMRSMGTYVHHRLRTPAGKESFQLAMKEAIGHVSCGWEDVGIIKAKIEGIRGEAKHLYVKRFLNGRLEERRCHEMAVDIALDIVNSLEARFLIGQHDDAPRILKGKGLLVYKEENLF